MKEIPYFDAHCDTISCCREDGRSLRKNDGQLDLLRLRTYSRAVQLFALYHDAGDCPEDGMFPECQRQVEVFSQEMEKNQDIVMHCRTQAEILSAHASHCVAALLSCEGAELLDCDPERLDWAKSVGIKAINLTWNHANLLSGCHLSESERGLSARGRAFVRRAQELGILIDVSHLSDSGFWDVMEITQKPIIASHSNARAVWAHSRNLTDDMFRAIAESGGVVGINYYSDFVAKDGADTMDALLRHFDHLMRLGGENAIGLGGDFDGCDQLAGGMEGVQSVPLLWDALSQNGYTEDLLEKIFYHNFLRLM